MAAEIYNIHPETPEMRKIKSVAEAINDGAVVLYPTDTGFSLGCELSNKNAIEKIRIIRQLDKNHQLTFLCRDLSNISEFAQVDNEAYRALKSLIPGPYTFILPASKKVPKFAQNSKRNTAGIRVPDDDLTQLLLKEVGSPILSISAKTRDNSYETPDEIINAFEKQVDIVVKSTKYNFVGESTVLDFTEGPIYDVIREGAGIEKIKAMMT